MLTKNRSLSLNQGRRPALDRAGRRRDGLLQLRPDPGDVEGLPGRGVAVPPGIRGGHAGGGGARACAPRRRPGRAAWGALRRRAAPPPPDRLRRAAAARRAGGATGTACAGGVPSTSAAAPSATWVRVPAARGGRRGADDGELMNLEFFSGAFPQKGPSKSLSTGAQRGATLSSCIARLGGDV